MSTPALGSALVTGASAGIGATYADRLARRGHDLVLVARDAARLEALAARLRADTGVAVDVVPADLGKPADLARVEQRLREDKAIRMLVNNAGTTGDGALATADVDRIDAMLQLNIVALTRLAVAGLPRFLASGGGTIINLSSVTALMPEAFDKAYGASKAYVLNLSLGLHAEVGGQGIRVQAVLPGITRTDIWKDGVVDTFPGDMVMEVGDLVDAALRGLDLGEVVTVPPLESMADFEAMTRLRQGLAGKLSQRSPAARYR